MAVLPLAFRYITSHMSELDPEDSGQVSLKQLLRALQPVQQTLNMLPVTQPAAVGHNSLVENMAYYPEQPFPELGAGPAAATTLAAAAIRAEHKVAVQAMACSSDGSAMAGSTASISSSAGWEVHRSGGSGSSNSDSGNFLLGTSNSGSNSSSNGSSSSIELLTSRPVTCTRLSAAGSDDSLCRSASPFKTIPPSTQEGDSRQMQPEQLKQQHTNLLLPAAAFTSSSRNAGAGAAECPAAWALPPAPAPVRVASSARIDGNSSGSGSNSGNARGFVAPLSAGADDAAVQPVLWPMQASGCWQGDVKQVR